MLAMNRSVIAAAFFVSGFSALLLQVTWQRVLTQIIGVDSVAIAFIVTIFLLGLGAGSLLGVRFTRGKSTRALALSYCMIEIAIGICGAVSIPVLRGVNALAASAISLPLFGDFALNLLLLFVPTFLMGLTTPVIVQLMKRDLDDLGRTIGRYYGLNILGGAVGALLGGLVLIELLGLVGTTLLAASLNVALGMVVLSAAPRSSVGPAEPTDEDRRAARPQPALLAAVFLFGFATLNLQLALVRIAANYFTLSPITFSIALSVFLLLMAGGQLLGGHLVDRFGVKRIVYPMCAVLAAGVAALMLALSVEPATFVRLGAYVVSPSFASLVSPQSVRIDTDPRLLPALLFCAFMMACIVPFSSFFPMLVRIATRTIERAGSVTAAMLAAATLGNVVGAFLTGLVLPGVIGTVGAMIVAIVCCGAAIVLTSATLQSGRSGLVPVVAVTAAICAAAYVAAPRDYFKRFSIDRFQIASVVEGPGGVISVIPTQRFFTLLAMYRTESGLAITKAPVATDNYQAWRVNFSELLALSPEFRPKRILSIGLGHALLARALLDYPFVEKVVVVEISEELRDLVALHSHEEIRRIFDDPRVEIVIQDGRRYMQKALQRGERFDMVEIRINEPWRAGASSLFTMDAFANVRALLAPTGFLVVRPMMNHIATALRVFPEGVWVDGRAYAYFGAGPVRIPERAEARPDIAAALRSTFPGQRHGPDEPLAPLRVHHLQREQFASDRVNTDDHPVLEFNWLRGPDQSGDRKLLAASGRSVPVRTVPFD